MSDVTRFVDLQLARANRMRPGDIPIEMLDPTIPPSDDWRAWKPIPSVVTAEGLASFEAGLDLRLADAFRELLGYVHFLELDGPRVRFGSHPPDWRDAWSARQHVELREESSGEPSSPADAELFVIGSDTNDGGLICLDAGDFGEDGDCPVVFVDDDTGEATTIFSSCTRMFAAFAMAAAAGVDFFRHDEEDKIEGDSALETKRRLMLEFLAFDPEGAGGDGREFWAGSLAQALRERI